MKKMGQGTKKTKKTNKKIKNWSSFDTNGTHKYLTRQTLRLKYLLHVRLELPTFIISRPPGIRFSVLTYKYDALTDCATGAVINIT